MYRLCW